MVSEVLSCLVDFAEGGSQIANQEWRKTAVSMIC